MPTTGQGTPRGRPCGRPTVRRPRRPCSDRVDSRDSYSNYPATVTTVATARRLLAVAHLQRPYYIQIVKEEVKVLCNSDFSRVNSFVSDTCSIVRATTRSL